MMGTAEDGRFRTLSFALLSSSSGRPDEADTLLSSIEGLLPRMSNPTFQAYDYWMKAVVRWVGGDRASGFELALQSAAASLEMRFSGGLLAARIAIAMGDRERLRRAVSVAESDIARGAWIDAVRRSLQAATAAMDDRPEAALSGYRQSLAALRTLGAAWTEALAVIEMATVLDPASADVISAGETAREILTTIGARPFISMLDQALARESQPAM